MIRNETPAQPNRAESPRSRLWTRRAELSKSSKVRGNREHNARQRAEMLLDAGSFVELSPLRMDGANGPGVVAGWGTVDGRPVTVVSHDASVVAGTIGSVFADTVQRVQRLAIHRGHPIVYINDSGGARIHDGVHALNGCGGIFALNVQALRRIPQISLILGPCAGAAAYSPALTDWTIMAKGQGQMFLTGPEIVRAAIGEDISADSLGGSQLHTQSSGVAHLEVASEEEALDAARQILSFVPSAVGGKQRRMPTQSSSQGAAARVASVVPDNPSITFDMREVLDGVLDEETGTSLRLELSPKYAANVITMLARLDGWPVGVVANQPLKRGGILDSSASIKTARFVEFCSRYGLSIITFVDVPGFLPGGVEEARGAITNGALVLRSYAEATSPVLTVIVRKAYGGAYIAMGSRSIGADVTWAWCGSEIAVMGPGGAVALLHRTAIREAEDPDVTRDELGTEYRERVARPYLAAEAGIIDDVIYPEETRGRLADALGMLNT